MTPSQIVSELARLTLDECEYVLEELETIIEAKQKEQK